jgi:conserved repeat domain
MKILSLYEHPEIAATKVTNTATVQSDGTAPISAEATFFVETSADLMVTQTTNKSEVCVGDELTYIIVITNNGPSNATGISLTDIISKNADLVSVVFTEGDYRHFGCHIIYNLNELAKGASVTIYITIIPKVAGVIKNFAHVIAKEPDPNLNNNKSTEITTVCPPRYRGFDFF